MQLDVPKVDLLAKNQEPTHIDIVEDARVTNPFLQITCVGTTVVVSTPVGALQSATYQSRMHVLIEKFSSSWAGIGDMNSLHVYLGDGLGGGVENIPGQTFAMCVSRRSLDEVRLIPDVEALQLSNRLLERSHPLSKDEARDLFHGRSNTVYWRGSSTGPMRWIDDDPTLSLATNARVMFCSESREFRPLLDARITQIVQVHDQFIQASTDILTQWDILDSPVPRQSFSNFQAFVDLAGNAAAWGTLEKHLDLCLVIRPETPWVLAYYDRLIPWVNYVPVASADPAKVAQAFQETAPTDRFEIAYSGYLMAYDYLSDILSGNQTGSFDFAKQPALGPRSSSHRTSLELGIADRALATHSTPMVSVRQYEPSQEGRAVLGALRGAIQYESPLPNWIRELEGMSGQRYRAFINHLMVFLSNSDYLEIGSYRGSTACAAGWGNATQLTCVDNWSEFGGPREEFLQAIERAVMPPGNVTVIEADFRNVDYSRLGPFRVFLFDGPHTEEEQYAGVCIAQPALADKHVLIVDDWNWPQVRSGTRRAIAHSGLTVLFEVEIFTTPDDSHPEVAFQHSDWHNGYYIAVLVKEIINV